MNYLKYRLESIFLLIVFVGAFLATVISWQAGWMILACFVSAIYWLHLARLKCPRCEHVLMRRVSKNLWLPFWRILFPLKCDSCGLDLKAHKSLDAKEN